MKLKYFAVENRIVNRAFISFSFFAALLVLSPFINIALELRPKINDFSNHVISNAAANDLDISGRISGYYDIFFGLVLITALVYGLTTYVYKKKSESKAETIQIALKIHQAALVGIAGVFVSFLFVSVNFATAFVFLFCLFLLFRLISKEDFIHHSVSIWSLMVAFPFVSIVSVFVLNGEFNEKLNTAIGFKNVLLPTDYKTVFLFVIYAVFAFILLTAAKMMLRKADADNRIIYRNALFIAALPLMGITILESAFLEFSNVLNVRFGYVFDKPMKMYVLLAVVALVAFAILFIRLRKRKSLENLSYNALEKYYYPLMIIAMVMMIVQPWRMMNSENEFFEAANHGLSIDHFFRYGSIPIIETFDAHMFSIQFFGYIYGFLNGYEPWAIMLYANYFMILGYWVIFAIFKKVLPPTTAFLIVVSLPLMSLLNSQFVLSGLLALAVIQLVKSDSTRNCVYFWMAAIGLCFYRLDVGFAALLSGMLTYVASSYVLNKSVRLKKLFISGSIAAGCVFAVFILLCLLKSINPVTRFYEFLLVSMSNQNWAIDYIGDVGLTIFRIAYYVLPLIVFVMFGSVAIKLLQDSNFLEKVRSSKIKQYTFILFLFFTLVFFFNIPRGIVRHTLIYGTILQITSTIPFAILMYVLLIRKNNKLFGFLLSFIAIYVTINLTAPSMLKKERATFSGAFDSAAFQEKFYPASDFKGTRVRETFDFSELKTLKKILDAVLKPNETYFDFSSNNLYHALVQRKNPVYVNQSPLMLNGDKMQLMALEEIRKMQTPIVLMPIRSNQKAMIDDMFVDYKYYLITEYIYKNYSPIIRFGTFDIYALNSKKDSYLNTIKKGNYFNAGGEINDFSFLQDPAINLGTVQISKNAEGKFTAVNTGGNAYIQGILSVANKKGGFGNIVKNQPINLTFNITPGAIGSIKLYYILDDGGTYNETNAKEFPITALQSQDFLLSLEKMPIDIMFTLKTSSVVFNTLKIVSSLQSDVTKPEAAEYKLGELPRVWAEKSGESVFSKVGMLSEPVTESNFTIEKASVKNYRKPFYLYVEANSNTDVWSAVTLSDENGTHAVFDVFLKTGTHQYAIRLSANYYWWQNTPQAKVSLASKAPINVTKFSLISEDGTEEIRLKKGPLTLSNITDEFWDRGVGLQNNFLLVANSPSVAALLQTAKKIVFKDGSAITIQKIEIVGDYIHIITVENVADFKEVAAFPNPIEIAR